MNDDWKLWESSHRRLSDTVLLRYGIAAIVTLLALLLTFRMSELEEIPFLLLLGAVTMSALIGGLGPGIFSTVLSALAFSFFFVPPYYEFSLHAEPENILRVGMFVMVSLMAGCFVAGCRRTKDNLEESEERYRILAQTASDAIVIIDREDRILFVNPAAEKIFGFSSEQMLAKKFGLLVPAAQYQPHLAELKQDLDTRKVALPTELRGHHQSGTTVPLEITFGTFCKNGRDVFTAIIRDVTRRKQAEEALSQKEQELRDFVENASLGLHWLSDDGRILWANQAEMDLLGYSRGEYIGHHIAEFYADRPAIEDILQRLKNKETLHNYEARLRRKDGSIKHVLINSNVLWKDGEFVHTRCFTRDITDRKQAEEAHSLLASIVQSSDDAIIGLTLNGIILSWNAGAEQMYGYSADEIKGRPVSVLIPRDLPEELAQTLEKVNRGKRVTQQEAIGLRKDGQRIRVFLTFSPIMNSPAQITGVSLIARDMTDQKVPETTHWHAEDFLPLLLKHERFAWNRAIP